MSSTQVLEVSAPMTTPQVFVKGQRALVTGRTPGIGEAVAKGLAATALLRSTVNSGCSWKSLAQ